MQLKTINLLSKMKIVKNLTLPVLVFLVMGLASCSSDDNTVHYSTNSLKNTELMTVLKSKGYQFDKDGKLELNDLANNTTSLDLSGTNLKDLSGLDILPNLKDVKLSNNGYGPVFDFAQLPVEKPLYFDPFGQIEFAPVGHNIIAPCKVLVQGSILFYPFRDSGFS